MNKGRDSRRDIHNILTPPGNAGQRWGTWLRLQRDGLSVTQDAFARQIASLCTYRNEQFGRIAQGLGLHRDIAIAAFEISRFEKGVRVPAHRSTHLILIWVLQQLGSQLDADGVNDWLEMGGQGWLTDRERAHLFPETGHDPSGLSDADDDANTAGRFENVPNDYAE